MKKEILYLISLICFAGIFACTTKKDTEIKVDEPMEVTAPIINEAVVDSIGVEIEGLEKEIDAFLESID